MVFSSQGIFSKQLGSAVFQAFQVHSTGLQQTEETTLNCVFQNNCLVASSLLTRWVDGKERSRQVGRLLPFWSILPFMQVFLWAIQFWEELKCYGLSIFQGNFRCTSGIWQRCASVVIESNQAWGKGVWSIYGAFSCFFHLFPSCLFESTWSQRRAEQEAISQGLLGRPHFRIWTTSLG